MKQSTSITNLAAALVSVQSDLRAIAKDSVNPHFKSKFASLDAIIADVRPRLAAHGLAIIQGATTPESDANSHLTAITVETTLVHSSGEWLSSGVVIPLAKADPQGAGAAMTYGRRYSLAALLSIATEEDDDGNSASQRSGGTGRAAKRSATATTQPAVTVPVPVLTRDSFVPFAPAFKDGTAPTIGELPYKFLQFVMDAPDKRIPEPHRAVWRAALQRELDGRSAGEFSMNAPAGSGV